jgi:hypothetical protein
MSGKTGRRPTGRKPESAPRQNAKTTGAFGKETSEQVSAGDANRNVDKSTRKSGRSGSGR